MWWMNAGLFTMTVASPPPVMAAAERLRRWKSRHHHVLSPPRSPLQISPQPTIMPSRVSARDRLRAWEAKHGGMCGSPRLHEPLRKTEEEGEEEEDLDWAGMQAAASGIHPRSPEVTMAIHDLAEECTDAMTFTVNRLDLDQEATVVGGPGTSNCEEEDDDGARVDPSEAMAESMIDVFIRGGYTVAEDRKVKLQPAPRAAFSMKEYGE